MVKLKIDPEFRDKIPPLTEDEYKQLRENILSDGEVYEPIVTWNDTIVDGHNRWKIICENWELLKDKFRTKPMKFSDKWAAFEWMYKKQLGRRNLTDEQRTLLAGRMYEARKNTQAFKGNQYTQKSGDGQNVQNQTRREQRDGTALEIGREIGMGERSVRRAAKFAKGIDSLNAVSPKAADKVLEGNSGATKQLISSLPEMPDKTVAEIATKILDGKLPPKPVRPMSKAMKHFSERIFDTVAAMENPKYTYTLDDAIRDLNSAEDVFMNQINFILAERKSVIESDERGRDQVIAFFDSVINDLKMKMEEIK